MGGAFSVRMDRPGEESYDAIWAVRSTIPGGVHGEAVEVGEVEVDDEHVEGVSGVAGGVPYEDADMAEPGGGGWIGLGGEVWRCPKEGMGLVLELGGGMWEGWEDEIFAFFDTIWSE
jgi:hypothetical protein